MRLYQNLVLCCGCRGCKAPTGLDIIYWLLGNINSGSDNAKRNSWKKNSFLSIILFYSLMNLQNLKLLWTFVKITIALTSNMTNHIISFIISKNSLYLQLNVTWYALCNQRTDDCWVRPIWNITYWLKWSKEVLSVSWSFQLLRIWPDINHECSWDQDYVLREARVS